MDMPLPIIIKWIQAQGGNEAYIRLGEEFHKRGMKLIQDAVYNHWACITFSCRIRHERLGTPMAELYTNQL